MKPVMLATDGSPTAAKAAETAIELARKLQTRAGHRERLGHPVPGLQRDGIRAGPDERGARQAGRGGGRKALGEAATRGGGRRRDPHRGPSRFSVEAICEAADRFAPLFLVIGSHGWGAVKRALFGSVSTGVLHHASCPVLVVRAESVEGDTADEGSPRLFPRELT